MEKTVEKKSEEVVLAKRSMDLTDEEIEALKKVSIATVYSMYNKKYKRWNYTLEIHLIPNRIKDSIPLTLTEFNNICFSNGIQPNYDSTFGPERIDCRVRFVKGIGSNQMEYKSCQLFPIAKNDKSIKRNSVFKSYFVDEGRENEFKIFGANIKYFSVSEDEKTPFSLDTEYNY